jgi:hypothetical protein
MKRYLRFKEREIIRNGGICFRLFTVMHVKYQLRRQAKDRLPTSGFPAVLKQHLHNPQLQLCNAMQELRVQFVRSFDRLAVFV